MLRLYCIGLLILLIAILANAITGKLGLVSWYDFIKLLTDSGANAFKQIGILDYLWLFVGYPLILSCGYLLGDRLYLALFG